MKKYIFTDFSGSRFFLTEEDDWQFYEQRGSVTDAINIINYILQKKYSLDICVDFGANQGAVTMAMWRKATLNNNDGKVFSVEADPYNIKKLHYNIRLNGYPEEYITHAALCDKDEAVELNIWEGCNGWQSMFELEAHNSVSHKRISVPGMSVYSFLRNNAISNINLLKIDIEGMELTVLEQLKPMLAARKIDELIVEANNATLKALGKNAQSVKRFFGPYPYDLYGILENGEKALLPEDISKSDAPIDILAVLQQY